MSAEPASAEGVPTQHPARPYTLALFARALILPFEHPLRWLAAGLPPMILFVIFERWAIEGFGLFGFPWAASWGWLSGVLSLGLLVFWCCAWQRGIARSSEERMMLWLRQGLGRLPSHLVASVAWLLPPILVSAFLYGTVSLIVRGAELMPAEPDGYEIAVILCGFLLLSLPGLWLLARLSLFPPIVAAYGWTGATDRMGSASRGRNLTLMVAFFLLVVLVLVLVVLLSFASVFLARAAFSAEFLAIEAKWAAAHIAEVAVQSFAMILLVAWTTAFPALIVRSEVEPHPLDPTTFD